MRTHRPQRRVIPRSEPAAAAPLDSLPFRQDGPVLVADVRKRPLAPVVTTVQTHLATRPGLSVCLLTDYLAWRGLDLTELRHEIGSPDVTVIPADRFDECATRRARGAVDAAAPGVSHHEIVQLVVGRLKRPRVGEVLEEALRLPPDAAADTSRKRVLRRRLRQLTAMGILEWGHLIRLARCPRLGRSVGSIAADLDCMVVTLRKWTRALLGLRPHEYAAHPGLSWVLELGMQRLGALAAAHPHGVDNSRT